MSLSIRSRVLHGALLVLVSSCGDGEDAAARHDDSVAVTEEAEAPHGDVSATLDDGDAASTDDVEQQAAPHPTSIDEQRLEILRIAYDAASMMPVMPHIKTRSRLQAESTVALIEAGGAALAPEWADGIDNWRKGLAYGTLAAHYAMVGDEANALEALAVAEELEAAATEPNVQGWRRNQIKVSIAEAYAYLGNLEPAAAIQSQLGDNEAGQLAVLASKLMDESAIDSQLGILVKIAETGNMDQVRRALEAVVQFYERLYDRPERRDEMEAAIRGGWDNLPLQPRIELLEMLIDIDIANANLEKALSTTDDVEAMVVQNTFNPDQQISMRAKVASLRARAGDREAGLRMADDALTMYDETRDSITDMYRGRALRPLAAAYVALGETMTANDLMERALVEAVQNLNSRPRAEDLVATCIAITSWEIEPRESLVAALRKTKDKLSDPW